MSSLNDNLLPVLSSWSRADQSAIHKSLQVNEGSVVPVVFGECKVEGQQLWIGEVLILDGIIPADKVKLLRYGDMDKAYSAEIWFAICMGRAHLVQVRANDKVLVDLTDYDSVNYYNDGTQDFIPQISSDVQIMVGGSFTTIYSIDPSWNITLRFHTNVYDKYIMCASNNESIFIAFEKNYDPPTISYFMYSYNGKNWYQGQVDHETSSNVFYSMAYNFDAPCFIAVGGYGVSPAYALAYRSLDGIAWTRTLNNHGTGDAPLFGVCYGGGQFVAVGRSGLVYTSPDGITWTQRQRSQPHDYYAVAYGNGIYLAVGSLGEAVTSPDGIVWTHRATGTTNALRAVVFNGDTNTFIAVGDTDTTAATSDGTSWVIHATGFNQHLYMITYGNGKYIAGGADGGGMFYTAKLLSSDDGTTWHNITPSSFIGNRWEYGVVNDFANFAWATKLKGIAHIFFPRPDAGTDMSVVCDSNATTPKMEFIIRNLLEKHNDKISNCALYDDSSNFIGNNPAAVIYEVLTNKQWGLGVDESNIDIASFDTVAATFTGSRKYGVNIEINDLVSAKEIIDKIREMTDIFLYEENDTFYLKMLYSSAPAINGYIVDGDITDLQINKQAWKEIDNVFEGEYTDPSLNYEKKTIVAKNEAAILMADGSVRKKKIDLTYFISADMASARVNEIMQRETYPKITVSCSINRHAGWNMRPGDYIQLSNLEYNLYGFFRVASISAGKLDEMTMAVELIQAFEQLWDGKYKLITAAVGSVPQRT